jgi:peptidoglycan/xylan/chitin deacetylase (PgdA/CDA1 family)
MSLPLSQMKKALIKATGLRRHHVAAARMFCERHGLATMSRFRSPGSRSVGRILCYHSIGQTITGVNDVLPTQFRRHIELALRSGFRFVSAAQIARTGGSARDLAITFDDGWTSVMSTAAPILRSYDIPWLLFVVTNWSNHRSAWARQYILPWRDLERLVAIGVQIGSHSATHPDFASIERAQMVDELSGSRETIRRHLGFAPTTFAIPLGQSMNWSPTADKVAREVGYEIVFAQAEETRPSGTIARTFVTRFDGDRIFSALLSGAYDCWQEWV